MHKICLFLLLLCIPLVGFPTAVVGDEGSDFLDKKEQDVERIVNLSITNAEQQCELLATCNNPTNCSHDACSMEDTGDYQCRDVNNNRFCFLYGTNMPCKNMNLDYGRSYVRAAASTNVINSVDTMLAICSQRPLEPLFKNLSIAAPLLTRAYFAAMDGSFRIYPGTPQDADNCKKFDPRIRPWFRTSTSVVKILVVLIDLGASMGNNLPPDLGAGTILQAAKDMAKELLRTLSATDYVNIVMYDSSRVIPLSPSAVFVSGTEATELDSLRTELDKQTVEGQNRQSNLSAAILVALPNFESNTKAAKLIVVITDGVFATLGSNVALPTAELSDSGVKIFIYKLRQPNDNNIFLINNTLIQQLCALGGHFEPILKNLENPLLAFQKYFSYLANLNRVLTNGRPQYSYIYEDIEGIGGNITTLCKPVFVRGDLIGVAGITIYINGLGNITNQVYQALSSRTTGYSPVAPDIALNATNCSVVNGTMNFLPCGSGSAQNGGLCKRADPPKSTIQELLCCGTCSDRPRVHPGRLIAGIVIGSLGLIFAVLACIFVYCKRKRKHEEREHWLANLQPPVNEPRIEHPSEED
ncbi:hypothetical protein M758_6G195700 [Ceratodon purpureus]|nr:hypothetical protein M758_6G195700 [Ceratodon purpureus]